MNNQLGNTNLISRSKSEYDASPPATPSPPPPDKPPKDGEPPKVTIIYILVR